MSTHCSIRRIVGRRLLATALTFALTACGGGGGSTQAPSSGGDSVNQLLKGLTVGTEDTPAVPTTLVDDSWLAVKPATSSDAARFLTQATFGPTEADIQRAMTMTHEEWIDSQISAQPQETHVAYWDRRHALLRSATPVRNAEFQDFTHSFWKQALTGNDQLRQRVAFALSQIFVVSGADGCGANNSRGLASYYDMLTQHAFGSYRVLLENVALHPVMGCYLSHMKNQKENLTTGRVPDENFAREIMQLFSIGLHQLNQDGTVKTDTQGNPLETYGPADIAGLAAVFTGFSFACPAAPADSCFYWGSKDGAQFDDKWSRPMVPYAQHHAHVAPKSFLGVTIAPQTQPDPLSSLKTALDALASNHPNVGPFIGKQLIQRLVTSNPSPAYVSRVAQAFEGSGRNLGVTVKAILLDPEARNRSALSSDTFGKVREPVLRLSAFLRAVEVQSASGEFLIDPTDDPATALGQSPMKAPSVFNFFRPGFVFPGGASEAAGMVAPELQIINESSVAGYVNFIRDTIRWGEGRTGLDYSASRRDVHPLYISDNQNVWNTLARASDIDPLLARIDRLLLYGTMPAALKAEIKQTVEGMTYMNPANPQPSEIKNRLFAALLLTVASPEFLVQR